eukprot:Tbor_TRINITY_DN5177_c0_g1::TRINITY_DN5177_c0_g1_i1::g.26238::m.26238
MPTQDEIVRILSYEPSSPQGTAKSSVMPITPSLTSLLADVITKETFLKEYYQPTREASNLLKQMSNGPAVPPKALVVKVKENKHRAKRLSFLKSLMNDFHPVRMLEDSNSLADGSSGVNVWVNVAKGSGADIDENGGKVTTVRVGEASQAALLYKAGNNLYFRGSEEMEASFVPTLLEELGHTSPNARYYKDGGRRGEIETFASHIGHTTNWHWDFQENFTVQLRGAKTWYLYSSQTNIGSDGNEGHCDTISAPHRAMAMHFGDQASKHLDPKGFEKTITSQHMQHALHKGTDDGASFSGAKLPMNINNNCVKVTLEPGDVLYHPAGIWHKVETVSGSSCPGENSLSINISLFPQTWADCFLEGLNQFLVSQFQWRQRMVLFDSNEATEQLQRRMTMLGESLVNPNSMRPFNASDLLPLEVVANSDSRNLVLVLYEDGSLVYLPDDKERRKSTPSPNHALSQSIKLRRNSIAVLIFTSDQTQSTMRKGVTDPEMIESLFLVPVEESPGIEGDSGRSENEDAEEEEGSIFDLKKKVIPYLYKPKAGQKRQREANNGVNQSRTPMDFARFDFHINFVGSDTDGPLKGLAHTAIFVEGKIMTQFIKHLSMMPTDDLLSSSQICERFNMDISKGHAIISKLEVLGFFSVVK